MFKIVDVHKEALKHYPIFLSAILNNSSDKLFPLEIKVSRPQKKDDRSVVKSKIEYLESNSKKKLGYGYEIEWESSADRVWKEWNIPKKVFFKDQIEFVGFLKKEKEVFSFTNDAEIILNRLPELTTWVGTNPLEIVANHGKWNDIINVCEYFKYSHVLNQFYIRELPINNLHTKFIEHNQTLLIKLIDLLISDKNIASKQFTERYFLKDKERLVRVRILCDEIRSKYNFDDFSIKLSDFKKSKIDCHSIIITENELNFLTLPKKSGFIAVWSGGGYNVLNLGNIDWLNNKNIYYWGDMDVAGLDILSKFRKLYQHTKSLMMSTEAFSLFYDGVKSDKKIRISEVNYLTDSEISLLNLIKSENLRLEQERLPQVYVNKVISNI